MSKEKSFKPMLAGTPDSLADVRFPVLASPKLDGVRAVKRDGLLLSRSLKPIPNVYLQGFFSNLLDGLDGELIAGNPWDDPYRRTVSAVMSEDGAPDVTYWVFDALIGGGFKDRFNTLADWHNARKPIGVRLVPHVQINSLSELEEFEKKMLAEGYEGAMVRALDGPYKYGRSTVKENYLLKIKRFVDSDAEIIGTYERMHNGNEATTNELGHTERSTCREGLSGWGDLGGFNCRDLKSEIEFSIGTGFTAEDRIKFWAIRESLVGKTVKYKFFATGSKEKPRFPVVKRTPEFIGLRDTRDM